MSNTSGSKWIRPAKRLAIYHRDGFACVYCGRGTEHAVLTLDHIVPRELGGTHDAFNLVTACVKCNSSRQDLPLQSWLVVLRDRGVRTARLPERIRRLTATPLDMRAGHAALAARRGK